MAPVLNKSMAMNVSVCQAGLEHTVKQMFLNVPVSHARMVPHVLRESMVMIASVGQDGLVSIVKLMFKSVPAIHVKITQPVLIWRTATYVSVQGDGVDYIVKLKHLNAQVSLVRMEEHAMKMASKAMCVCVSLDGQESIVKQMYLNVTALHAETKVPVLNN